MPKHISFIIPAHDEEKHLDRCLKSILDQNTTDVEVVMVDDGSQDATFSLMREYEAKYPFIKAFHEDGCFGPSHARNIGLDNATGDYIWFMDADDYLLGGAIDYIIDEIRDGSECVFFSFKRERDGSLVDNAAEFELTDIPTDRTYTGQELFKMKSERLPRVPDKMAFVVSRDFVENNDLRFVEGAIFEDGMFGMEIYLKAVKVKQLTKPLFVYYNNLSSIGHAGFNRVYVFACCFVKYVHCALLGMDHISDDAFMVAYAKNLHSVYQRCQEFRSKLKSDDDPLPAIEKIDRRSAMIYMSMSHDLEEDGLSVYETELMKADRIIVYGAANKARKLAGYLDGIGKQIVSYVVSDEVYGEKDRRNPGYIYGVPVIPFSKTESLNKDDLVVVTLRKVHWESITQQLKDRGFTNILCIE